MIRHTGSVEPGGWTSRSMIAMLQRFCADISKEAVTLSPLVGLTGWFHVGVSESLMTAVSPLSSLSIVNSQNVSGAVPDVAGGGASQVDPFGFSSAMTAD